MQTVVLNRRTGARRLRDERGVMGIVKGKRLGPAKGGSAKGTCLLWESKAAEVNSFPQGSAIYEARCSAAQP